MKLVIARQRSNFIPRLGRVTLKMYSDTVTNYFIKKVFSNVIQVPEYESNVTDYFWITSRTDIIKTFTC